MGLWLPTCEPETRREANFHTSFTQTALRATGTILCFPWSEGSGVPSNTLRAQGGLASLGFGEGLPRTLQKMRGSEEAAAADGLVSIHLQRKIRILPCFCRTARNVGALTAHVHHLPVQRYLLDREGRLVAQGDGQGHQPRTNALPPRASAWER